MKFPAILRVLAITAVITVLGNYVGYKVPPLEAVPGLFILVLLSVLGYGLSKIIPFDIPSIAYISALAIVSSLPGVPGSDLVVRYVGKVQFLALCTPILAYAGISIGKDLNAFKQQGAKLVVVALLTFIGTFVGSAIIAQIVLSLTGVI